MLSSRFDMSAFFGQQLLVAFGIYPYSNLPAVARLWITDVSF